MTFRTRALTVSAASAVAAAVVVVLLALGGADASPAAQTGAVVTGCDQQSFAVMDSGQQTSATFPGAHDDPRNLVAGPLAILGGAVFTDAVTARRFGGNKYAVVVRAGHRATVSIPASARRTASLGYGPLPEGELGVADGHHTVTFVACPAGKPPRDRTRSAVRFWMGFVMVGEPRCVPLDVYADGDPTAQRIAIELGARCAKPPPQACAADHPAFSYDGPVGPLTGFSGGFELKRTGCLPVQVRVAGRPTVRGRLPFGVRGCATAG
jgi:hypothetical protein